MPINLNMIKIKYFKSAWNVKITDTVNSFIILTDKVITIKKRDNYHQIKSKE